MKYNLIHLYDLLLLILTCFTIVVFVKPSLISWNIFYIFNGLMIALVLFLRFRLKNKPYEKSNFMSAGAVLFILSICYAIYVTIKNLIA